MCIERKLGDRSSEASYVSQLRNRYPESAEAQGDSAGHLRVSKRDASA